MSRDSWFPPVAVSAGLKVLTCLMLMMMMTPTVAAQDADPPQPEQIEWDLGEIYPSFDAWSVARAQLEERVAALAAYRGRLGESAATLQASKLG